MAHCETDNCELDRWEQMDHCVLHCEKDKYQLDYAKVGFLHLFYEELIKDIANQLRNASEETKLSFQNFLRAERLTSMQASQKLAKTDFLFDKVRFPAWDSRDEFNYLKVLRKLQGIHFRDCYFHAGGIDIGNTKQFYDGCLFHRSWTIYDCEVLRNERDVAYQNCTFEDSVVGRPYEKAWEEPNPIIRNTLFSDCVFEKDLELAGLKFESPLFNNFADQADNSETNPYRIGKLYLHRCTFSRRFVLRGYSIDKFQCDITIFENKVEFKRNEVGSFTLFDTNFLKLSDFYRSKFLEFRIEQCIFAEFAVFEECEFGQVENSDKKLQAQFNFVTFEGFVNFRRAKMYSGLDIEKINYSRPINFLNVTIGDPNTTRETYRIVKSSFEKAGNNLDANKYFALELSKYREELKETGTKREKFIYWFNELVSDYGQNYVRPIYWIMALAFLNMFLNYAHCENYLYKIYPPFNHVIECGVKFLNELARVIPFQSTYLTEGMELLSLLIYICFTTFVWQAVVAVKRHTRR
jgi:hypothetical protein